MSGKLSKKRVFSQKDWNEADMLGKIEISLINPEYFVLAGKEQRYYVNMRKCFHVLCECYSELEAYRLLKEVFVSMSHNSIYKLIADTQKFFSSIIQQNVQFDKIIQSNRILKHIEAAQSDGDHAAVARLEKIWMHIRETDTSSESAFDWSMLQLPNVEETSDTTVLFEEAEVDEEE